MPFQLKSPPYPFGIEGANAPFTGGNTIKAESRGMAFMLSIRLTINSTHMDLQTTTCPNCLSAESSEPHFYRIQDIPRQSCLMMPSKQAAKAFPSGRIDLRYCPDCGFIYNAAFDPNSQTYNRHYEESQAFSPTFSRFSEALVNQLIDEHGLRNKRVLEIGCGKGDFLVQLCQRGNNSGIGIDPSHVPGRNPQEKDADVRFIHELFGRQHMGLEFDAIICRHTLEHIGETARFMRLLREVIGDRDDTLVFIEVPDVTRILHERAFWDIYYEHCSYFSPSSLAHLLSSSGFMVTHQAQAFDDQYLLLAARPGSTQARSFGTPDITPQQVENFATGVIRDMATWKHRISEDAAAGKNPVVWGSGSKGVAFLSTLGIESGIERVVDINPYRQGRFMAGTGQAIVAPEALNQVPPRSVYVMNPVYREEIARQLQSLGIEAELICVGEA